MFMYKTMWRSQVIVFTGRSKNDHIPHVCILANYYIHVHTIGSLVSHFTRLLFFIKFWFNFQVAKKLIKQAISPQIHKSTRQRRAGRISQPIKIPQKRPRLNWTDDQTETLLRTISADFKEWPQMSEDHQFWTKAAAAIKKKTGVQRTGMLFFVPFMYRDSAK